MSQRSNCLAFVTALFLVHSVGAQEPLTVAEKSDFKATSRHADVLRFCDELAKKSNLVRIGEMGISGEGRKLPLIIIADPPVANAVEAKRSGKLIAFAQANIHAGEVDGKEALMMLARDLTQDSAKPLLKDLVIVLCPNFNPDGNERIDVKNRVSQAGPVEGVGIRANAAGLDLNRDFVKLESPEVRALVKFMNTWDPALFIDCHTTNGSYHRYTLTYDGPRHPNAVASTFIRDTMLPEVGKRLDQKGYKTFYYGNFNSDRSRWDTYESWPRYGVQYAGLRNRLAVLSESYAYAPYCDRIMATKEFVRACFDYLAEQKSGVRKLINLKDAGETLALRTRPEPLGANQPLLGYVEEQKDGRRVPTDQPKEYSVRYYGRSEAELAAARPYAYLFPAQFTKAAEALQRHGITVEELREDIDLDVTAFRVDAVNKSERRYQGHQSLAPKLTDRNESRRVLAGTFLVKTTQPLGTLAGLLLDPRSEDGLMTWNFFDDGMADGKDAPILLLKKSSPIHLGQIRPLAENRTMNRRITVESMLDNRRPINLGGNPVSGLSWLDDGEHFLQVREGKLYKVQARTGRSEPFIDADKLAKSLAALPTLDRRVAQGLARGANFRMDPKRTGTLIEHENDLYFARFDGTPGVRLTRSPGRKEFSSFSPDGRFVAFVRNGNLYAVDVQTQAERALTTDGGGAILNGKADWVYFEEVFDRNGKAYWWSPDGNSIAYLRFDDAPVHKFTLVNPLPLRQNVEAYPYPKAGDPNPQVTLHVVSTAGGDPIAVDLHNYSPSDSIICRVGWLPDSTKLYFYVQNRAQTWLDFCTSASSGGPVTKLFRETTKAWVNDPGAPHFLSDGSFLLASERSGWKHLYHFDAAGRLLNAVTSGPWELRGPGGGPFQGKSFHYVDEKGGWVYVSGTKDATNAANLYRFRLDGSGASERLTREPGDHSVIVSPTGSMFIDSHSDSSTPTKVHLRANDGSPLRTLDSNPAYLREEYKLGEYERVQIPTKDGFVLEGSILKPPDFDKTRKYPVWFQTYGGPHAPTIVDSYAGGRAADQALASMGLIVFRCDPRSGSGKGACSAWTCYRKLGAQECQDVEEAIDWLCQKPWIDAKRIGMSGASYGGFLTAYCLTHSKKFAAGVASASVTDWRNYDSIYTERYMNTPQENPEGYDATSVVRAARNLHGKLLLVHGLMDDNVHPQNTIQLVDALQRADKDFEVMIYPRAKHGGFGKHNQRQFYDFIRRTVLSDHSTGTVAEKKE